MSAESSRKRTTVSDGGRILERPGGDLLGPELAGDAKGRRALGGIAGADPATARRDGARKHRRGEGGDAAGSSAQRRTIRSQEPFFPCFCRLARITLSLPPPQLITSGLAPLLRVDRSSPPPASMISASALPAILSSPLVPPIVAANPAGHWRPRGCRPPRCSRGSSPCGSPSAPSEVLVGGERRLALGVGRLVGPGHLGALGRRLLAVVGVGDDLDVIDSPLLTLDGALSASSSGVGSLKSSIRYQRMSSPFLSSV